MEKDLEKAQQIVSLALEVLSEFGVPGASLAKKALENTAAVLKRRETQQHLAAALQEAERDFIRAAREQGWHDAADAVFQLPIQDAPSFREALRTALEQARGEGVSQALEQALKTLPLSPQERAAAVLCYAESVWGRLWREPAFRNGVRDVLFQEQTDRLRAVEARLETLAQTLPSLVADERERRRREAAWARLDPIYTPLPEEPTREVYLWELKAQCALIPFTGSRQKELVERIVAWARALEKSSLRVGLRLYAGPGGAGKTRLLVEAGRRLEAQGWWARFVPSLSLDEVEEAVPFWARPERPTLLAMDYAESRIGDVKNLLRAVAKAAPCPQPLAVVLLMRQHSPDLERVLRDVTGSDVRWARFVQEVISEALVVERVPPLTEEDRPALFYTAREVFQKRLTRPATPVDYSPEALPGRPMALILLALLAASGHRVAASRNEQAILKDVWACWEQPKWDRYLCARGVEEDWKEEALDLIETALVAVTLGRPFHSTEEVARFWEAHTPPEAVTAEGRILSPRWLARLLPALFPTPGKEDLWSLPPITPDPLADHVSERRLRRTPTLLEQVLPTTREMARSPSKAADRAWTALTVLERVWAGQRHREEPEEGEDPTWRWVQQATACLADRFHEREAEVFPFLAYLERRLLAVGPQESFQFEPARRVALQPLAAEVWSAMARQVPEKSAKERARLLGNLGNALSALGRREEALAATQEAVTLYRGLAGANPQAFLPDLAASLNNLGSDLSALGRREEALAATQEAADLYRQLAGANPQAFLPDLARSLGAHGTVLLGLGRAAGAAQAFGEGLRILAPLARAYPQALGGLQEALREDYLRACREAGLEPEQSLL